MRNRESQENPATEEKAPLRGADLRRPFDDLLTAVPQSEEIEEGRAAAILAYVPFGCFVALVRYRDNPFAVRHGKQGLMLTFLETLAGLFLIPRLSEYFWVTVVFACLASAVTGIYYALQGREWTVPIAGRWFDEKIDLSLKGPDIGDRDRKPD